MEKIEKNRIILFNPQPDRTRRRVLPISLLAIASYLAKDSKGYNIQILHSSDYQECLAAIHNLDDVICVGISSMTGYQIIDGLNFAKHVRESNGNIPIVWGGIHPTIKPVQTIKNPYVDIVVRGQGERTFYELVKCLESGENLKKVLGIVYQKNNQIIENEPRPDENINNFSKLPYHILGDKIGRYIKPTPYSERSLPIYTSDGCPFRCSFCYMSMPEYSRRWVSFSAERVLDEIEYLVKNYDLDGISIRDSNFFIDLNKTKRIFEGIIERKLNISLTELNARVDQLLRIDDEYWELMEAAGVKEFLIGAESGDQDMLDFINKNITVEKILECEKKAGKYNITMINSFITGFPVKSKNRKVIKKALQKELYKTVDLIDEIYKVNPLATNMIFLYTPYPGTPLYQYCLECDFQEPTSLEQWADLDLNQKHFPWMSDKHIKKTVYFEKLFLIKKLTSQKYIDKKIKQNNFKFKILNSLGLLTVLNYLASFRIKYKITFLPFENLILK